ncbi:MAG TPA: hypothetical protein VJ617_12110 [Arthrobacter sp.]|nr:hypothetical protein [Arthrobacter sp.]
MTEAPITTTLKAPGANSPWVVLRSENTVQLSQQLAELQANTTFADLARANEAFQAHFTMGSILGARGVDAPVDTGAFTPPAAVPQPDAAAAALQQQIAALQAQQAAAAAPPAYSGGTAAATPGAPMVAGMPAKLVSGSSARGPWQAWADPRPKEATDHMAKTDDVNHPGLVAGTHKLWKFIR